MQIIKKANETFQKEEAHGGSGGRKLYIAEDEVKNFHGMTYGFLPNGSKFAWHSHENINRPVLKLRKESVVV